MTIGKRVAIWGFLLAIPIAGLLIGLYIVTYRDIPTAGMSAEGDAVITHNAGIGFVPTPNGRSKLNYFKVPDPPLSFNVYTDDRGARVSTPGQKSAAHVDIMVIGCSFTWGHGLDNPDTFPAKVAQSLGASVSNLAFASFGGVQSLLMLRQNRDLKPKLVIYGVIADHLRRNVAPCAKNLYPFCLDEAYVAFDSDGRPTIAPPFSNGVKRVQLQTKAHKSGLDPITWVTHGVDAAYGQVTMAISDARESDESKQDAAFAFVLKEMAATVDAMHAKLLVVYIPTYYAPAPPGIVQAIKSLKLPFIDMTDEFLRHKDDSVPVYIPKDGHPSAKGNVLIGEEIVRTVARERLLDR